MSEKFNNKYRIASARLQNWDYGWNASYFVTICTKNHLRFFGKIIDKEMRLNELGQIAHSCFQEIPEHFPFVILGDFVVMPNHVHGIIIINKQNDGRGGDDTTNDCGIINNGVDGIDGIDGVNRIDGIVETQNLASLPSPSPPTPPSTPPSTPTSSITPSNPFPFDINPFNTTTEPKNKFGPQSKNLASIIRGYKTGVTVFATINKINFEWQDSFHEHIIRNNHELRRIANYIINNPSKWRNDRFFNDNRI